MLTFSINELLNKLSLGIWMDGVMLHISLLTLHWKIRWFVVSWCSPHSWHVLSATIFLLCKFSAVEIELWATFQGIPCLSLALDHQNFLMAFVIWFSTLLGKRKQDILYAGMAVATAFRRTSFPAGDKNLVYQLLIFFSSFWLMKSKVLNLFLPMNSGRPRYLPKPAVLLIHVHSLKLSSIILI